ncbi:hypothetical protein [Streptomyces yaizuensis]|uniref:Uncharacterized protein n=1 Tax=Streptomyces yaizuensis TaxID=2989713 RepID=A0AA86IVM9_9ACTN|nr:hypothetical protein [Streptomyces sp. YSPA8]BDT39555.1 hypothetical protein SYYSPA8_37185 [Streptomyces sp. YSPA8]
MTALCAEVCTGPVPGLLLDGDVVITSADAAAYTALDLLERLHPQRASGPVWTDGAWLYWLVPPGAHARWKPHFYGRCVAGETVPRPPMGRWRPDAAAPSPWWVRLPRTDLLRVGEVLLRHVLTHYRPGPTPDTWTPRPAPSIPS